MGRLRISQCPGCKRLHYDEDMKLYGLRNTGEVLLCKDCFDRMDTRIMEQMLKMAREVQRYKEL